MNERKPYYLAARFQYCIDCNPTVSLVEEAISDSQSADFNVSCIGASFEKRFGWYVIVYSPEFPSEKLDLRLKEILSMGSRADIPEKFIKGFIEQYVVEDQKDKNLLNKPVYNCIGHPFSQN